MTPQEAIEIIDDVTWDDNGRHYGKITSAREIAKAALEYRTPKKYLLIGGRCICPTCKSNQGYLHQHCNNCGQKILWGDTE